jgi:oligosaccharide repeat unit polymerase
VAIFFGGVKSNPVDPWNQILAIWVLLGFLHPIARNYSNESYLNGQLGLSVIDSMPRASFYLALGMLFTLFGISIGERGSSRKSFLAKKLNLFLSPVAETILVIIWLTGTLLLLRQIGFSGLLQWRSRETQVSLLSVSSYLFFTNYLLIVPAILRLRKLNRSNVDLIVGLIFLYAPVLINTLSGNRIFVIPILILHFYLQSANTIKIGFIKVFVFFLVILVFISGLRFFRETSDPYSTYKNFTFSQQQISIFEGQDLAMLDNLSLLVRSQVRNPDFPLIDYLNIFTKPIPRQIWPSKPATFDQKLNSVLLPSKYQAGYGFSFTFIGESLYEIGVVGIPLVGFLFGVFLGRSKKWIKRGELSRHYVVGVIAIAMIIIFARGSFSADSPRFLFALLPLVLTKYKSLD